MFNNNKPLQGTYPQARRESASESRRDSSSSGVAGYRPIKLSNKTTTHRMEELHKLTEAQLKNIEEKLALMHEDLKKLEEGGPPRPKGPPGSGGGPKGFKHPGPKFAPGVAGEPKQAPPAGAGAKKHFLEPIGEGKQPPAPGEVKKAPHFPPPKQAAPKQPPPRKEPLNPVFDLNSGADHLLESPDGSSSDSDDSSTAAIPVIPAAAKAAISPTKPAATNARQGVGFNRVIKPSGSAGAGRQGSAPPRPRDDGPAAVGPHGGDESGVVMGVGRAAKKRGNMFNEELDGARAQDGQGNASRLQAQAVRNTRHHFFNCIPRLSDIVDPDRLLERNYLETEILLSSAPCSWLICISLAISFVTKVPTPIEKILRTNHLGLHHIALSAVTLAELYDCANDYIHSRFHRNTTYNQNCNDEEFEEDEEAEKYLSPEEIANLVNVHCEMATFDTKIIDPDDEDVCLGMGEHPPIPSLAQFRKELVDHANDPTSLYIFNFDPYIIEESEVRLRNNMAETEEEMNANEAAMRHTKDTKGCFGILLDFNPVQRTITFGVPHLSLEQHALHELDNEEAQQNHHRFSDVFANLILEEHTVSMQTLYEALTHVDSYSGLSRGFVRVFINEAFAPKVSSIFPLFVVDGSSAGGLMTNLLDVKIAPHVLGLAMLHHLAITFLLSDSARRKQSSRNLLSKMNVCDVKLRGIPLTKIIQQLSLPLSMIVGKSDTNSVATAFVWYLFFLQQLQVQSDVRLGLVLPQRRGGTEDGQPNVQDDEFLDHLRIVVESKSVMLIGFNLNRALNVRISDEPNPAHFAIVIGLDEVRGIVRLADVNVKRFRKTWHIPLQRLYNATMGFGYMVASSEKKVIKALNGKEFYDYALSQARFGLPPQTNLMPGRFEYPPGTYVVTVLADAVSRLGYRADVERFLNFSGFHYSYFLSKHMPLESAAFVLQNYSHYALDDALTISTSHFCYYPGKYPENEEDPEHPTNPRHVIHTEDSFADTIADALANSETKMLVVKYDHAMIRDTPSVWNGSNGGSYAVVIAFDRVANLVTLSNSDPQSFYRVFACPLNLLFAAVCSWDPEDQRARGTILIEKKSQELNYINTKGFDMAHCLVHHPFKPIFSAVCSCLALAATEMMQNIEAPQLLGGAPIASEEEDERKRYKRYNNIFSAEDFLYALPSFNVHDWEVRAQSAYTPAQMANLAFMALKLPLVAKDLLEEDPSLLEDPVRYVDACRGTSGLLTMTLISYDTDKICGIPGNSTGVVNRIVTRDDEDEDENEDGEGHKIFSGEGAGLIQLIEGDSCRWGMLVERTVEELMAATSGLVLIEEVMEEDREES